MAQILVVEDEIALVDVINAVLSAKGHTMLQAYDGQDGLDKALKEHPDVVIADQMLPVKTGLEICRALKEAQLEPPITFVLMTAGNVPVEDGCPDAILRKPFAIDDLEEKVNALIAARPQRFFG